MKGRRSQSAAVRAAKGDPGKRIPAKATEPETPNAAPVVLPTIGPMPRELTKQGKAVWNLLAPQLLQAKFLHPTDRISLVRYCDTVAEYWKVTRELRVKKYTYWAKKVGGGKLLRFNPLFVVQDRLARRLDTLESAFGLTPRSRQEIMYRLSNLTPGLPLAPPDPSPADPGAPAPDLAHDSAVGFLNQGDAGRPRRVH